MRIAFCLALFLLVSPELRAETDSLSAKSPDGKNQITVELKSEAPSFTYTVERNGKTLVERSPISIKLVGIGEITVGTAKTGIGGASQDETITPVWGKASKIANQYEMSTWMLRSPQGIDWELEVRAYDDGVAFRYRIKKQPQLASIEVESEQTAFHLTGDPMAIYSVLPNFFSPHESPYKQTSLKEVPQGALLEQPFTVTWPDGNALAITEARTRFYPGMYLTRPAKDSTLLETKHAPLPGKPKQIASQKELLESPWRVILLADEAGKFLESNLHVCLNDPPQGDFSWFAPGKSTWHWWNGTVDEGRGFEAGLNFETHKHYIDFCSKHGIEYHAVVCGNGDTPWYVQKEEGFFPKPDSDITKPKPELELPKILDYAKTKGVGIRLWVHWKSVDKQMEAAFTQYEKWGVRGLMVDFLDRNDQDMVDFCERVLKSAQKHHLHIQFHGSYPPSGEQYTYPNLINREGVLNLEYLKWTDLCSPEHSVNVAYTRAIPGLTDYHLGGFRSVPRNEFKPQNAAPNVLGTRSHHLALYVIFENAIPMVSDFPSAYENQMGFEFIEKVPTTWDETKFLTGKAGECIVLARRKGKTWYLGGITNWTAREIEIPLDFLDGKASKMTIFRDTLEAATKPNEIIREERMSLKPVKLPIYLGEGGGFAAIIEPIE